MMIVELKEDTMCAHDLYEMKNYPRPWFHAKPELPKGTRLDVVKKWTNFYGTYYRCRHENGEYDIPMDKAMVVGEG